VILAKLAGEDKPEGIAQWVRARAAWVVKIFGLARPDLPCANTYRRTLSRPGTAEALDAQVERYLAQLPGLGPDAHIALDGKTARGTIPSGESQGLHLLSSYVPAHGRVLRQVVVDGKENEISATPRVLAGLDLQGKVMTGDAPLA
jgi:hypothetical protein